MSDESSDRYGGTGLFGVPVWAVAVVVVGLAMVALVGATTLLVVGAAVDDGTSASEDGGGPTVATGVVGRDTRRYDRGRERSA